MIQSELRESVCVARYGGEEFGVLMLASVEETSMVLDRLREKMSKLDISHEGKRIMVTLSAGASQILPDEKIGKLVRRADEALYAAKLGGRNRVYLHDGGTCVLVTKCDTANSMVESRVADGKKTRDLELRIQNRLQRIVEEESRRKINATGQ